MRCLSGGGELKVDGGTELATDFCKCARFALCGLPVVKVGINFSSERRTLEEWKIVNGQ